MRAGVDCDLYAAPRLEWMAELAWRYGPEPLPSTRIEAFRFFPDGSILGPEGVDSPQGFRHLLEAHGWMR